MFDKLKRLLRSDTEPADREPTAREIAALTLAEAERAGRLLAHWKTDSLDGRRIDVYAPDSEFPPTAVVLFLHGHGRVMLNENPVFTRLLQDNNLAAVCPDGGGSWWLDVVCNNFDPEQTAQRWLMDSVVPFIESRFAIEPPRIALLGVSMGGQGALQLAYRYSLKFPIVAAISPAVDFQQLYGSGIPLGAMFPDVESARQATVVLNLQPLAWPRYQFYCCDPADTEWFDGAARLGMKLSSSGILHERDLETTAGGHTWSYFDHMAPIVFKHITDGLRKLE